MQQLVSKYPPQLKSELLGDLFKSSCHLTTSRSFDTAGLPYIRYSNHNALGLNQLYRLVIGNHVWLGGWSYTQFRYSSAPVHVKYTLCTRNNMFTQYERWVSLVVPNLKLAQLKNFFEYLIILIKSLTYTDIFDLYIMGQ